jgi:hypothetical protein
MNETEQMIHEIDGFLRAVGESPLEIPDAVRAADEIDLLRAARAEYLKRLIQRVPKYGRLHSEEAIPDMFLQALKSRAQKLQRGSE